MTEFAVPPRPVVNAINMLASVPINIPWATPLPVKPLAGGERLHGRDETSGSGVPDQSQQDDQKPLENAYGDWDGLRLLGCQALDRRRLGPQELADDIGRQPNVGDQQCDRHTHGQPHAHHFRAGQVYLERVNHPLERLSGIPNRQRPTWARYELGQHQNAGGTQDRICRGSDPKSGRPFGLIDGHRAGPGSHSERNRFRGNMTETDCCSIHDGPRRRDEQCRHAHARNRGRHRKEQRTRRPLQQGT